MAFTELLKRKLEDPSAKEKQEQLLRESAVSARSALRFVAYEANPNNPTGSLRAEKESPRGMIHVQIDPENPASATWVQRETTTDYFSTVKYRVSIGASGDFIVTRQVVRKTMNVVPLNEPISFRIGPVIVGFGYQYASTNIQEYDRLEKGLHDIDRLPKSFAPTVEFFDELRKDLLHGPIAVKADASAPQVHQVIKFPTTSRFSRTG